MKTTLTYCCGKTTFLLLLLLNLVATECSAEDVPLSLVLDFLRTRESRQADWVVEITTQEQVGPDYDAFGEAAADYDMYFSRFIGNPKPRKIPVNKSHRNASPAFHWRISMLSADNRKFELFNGPPTADGENLMMRECLMDGVWERYVLTDSHGPRVFLSNEPQGANALAVLGFVFPCAQISSRSLTELLVEYRATVRATQSGSFELTFRMPAKESASLLNEVILEVDPAKGFAPIRCACRWVATKSDQPKFQSRGFTAVWSDWTSLNDDIVVAGKCHITYEAQCFMPRDGTTGFKPLVVDGQVQMSLGAPIFDPESYDLKTFSHGEEIHLCTRFESPAGLVSPLCTSNYAEGTVVQDDRTKEVYQLTGAGPAIGNALTKQLEPVLGANANSSNRFRIPLIAANVLIFFVIAYVIYRRQKSVSGRSLQPRSRRET